MKLYIFFSDLYLLCKDSCKKKAKEKVFLREKIPLLFSLSVFSSYIIFYILIVYMVYFFALNVSNFVTYRRILKLIFIALEGSFFNNHGYS